MSPLVTRPQRSASGTGHVAGICIGRLRIHVWTRTYARVTLSMYIGRFGGTLDIGSPS